MWKMFESEVYQFVTNFCVCALYPPVSFFFTSEQLFDQSGRDFQGRRKRECLSSQRTIHSLSFATKSTISISHERISKIVKEYHLTAISILKRWKTPISQDLEDDDKNRQHSLFLMLIFL